MGQQPNRTSRKPKLNAAQFAARYKAERRLLQQRYCAALALWRACKLPRCHRERSCMGGHAACLKRALAAVPHAAQWQVRETILAATPKNTGAPERAARQCMPADLYTGTAAQAAADYLARFSKKPAPGVQVEKSPSRPGAERAAGRGAPRFARGGRDMG